MLYLQQEGRITKIVVETSELVWPLQNTWTKRHNKVVSNSTFREFRGMLCYEYISFGTLPEMIQRLYHRCKNIRLKIVYNELFHYGKCIKENEMNNLFIEILGWLNLIFRYFYFEVSDSIE